MPLPIPKKKLALSAVVVFIISAAALFLCPFVQAEDSSVGQVIDLDEPEPSATRDQPRVSDTGAPRETVQGATSRRRPSEPEFVRGLPPETRDAFDPWMAHENYPQAPSAESRAASTGNGNGQRMRPAEAITPEPRSSRVPKPTASELDEMMKKILDPAIDAIEKKRLAAVVFYHQDIYRRAAMLGEFPANSPQVKAFLEQKKLLQEEVISRMGPKYRNQYGEAFKQPIIPFDYNNIYSDDDIVVGTGEAGRRAEKLYNDSLNDVMREHVGRPMDALDRKRVDVNGLAWNMTEEAAYLDFTHHEKYINPQSGYANQAKLIEAAEKGNVTAFTFDDRGRMVKLSAQETVEEIKRLAVDQRLAIPGIDATKGTGSMSDFLRMAEMHSIRPNGRVTVEEVQQFIRNQKYSQRVIGDYEDIFQADAALSREYKEFIDTSNELRKALTVKETAAILERAYGTKIIQSSGAIDYDALTVAMIRHQEKQLTTVLPNMVGEVAKTEGYKIVEWLKNAGAGNRSRLRKEMALTYAPLDDNAVQKISAQLDSMPIDEADKSFLKGIVKDDSRQIRRYAELIQIPTEELTTRLKIDGDNIAVANFISKTAKVTPLTDALSARKGGGIFREFLESKTAKALNLDVMLSPEAKGEKYMQWCMLLVAASRAYSASGSNEEGLKAMGMATFEMVPFVASVLRFSEEEYKQAFVEFAMDLYPPIGLAHIATTVLNYGAHVTKDMFVESKWDQLAQSVLDEMSDDDFVPSDIEGYWRLKNRDELLEYLDEVSPGLGKIAKLSSLIAPDIDARMSRDSEAQANEEALYTILWFEGVKIQDNGFPPSTYIAKLFVNDLNKIMTKYKMEELQAKVYENGIPELGSAKPSERVAAKIMLDNLRIRKKLYYDVLNSFMDRIEKLYNKTKNQEEGGYGAIVGKAITALKGIYEETLPKLEESPWGKAKLDEDYRGRLEFMTKYKPSPSDKPALEIQREMQQVLDDFRELIQKLLVAVDIQAEMQYLDLKAAAYGGEKSFEPTDEILLGQPFRVGVSARVSPKRKDLKWTIYYYALSHESGSTKVLGTVKLDPKKFNSGNEGYWVIEAPEKDTFLKIDPKMIKEFFPDERWYFIRPVIAFGDWSSDPLGLVGADALKNPIEHPELFSKDRAAFVGERAEFGVFRGQIYASVPKWIYRNDSPKLQITLRLPYYAQEGNHSATVDSFAMMEGSPLPKLVPTKIHPVAADNYDPPEHVSSVDIIFPEEAQDASYGITVKAELADVDTDYWPLAQTLIINYVNKDNPETSPDGEGSSDGATMTANLAKMEALHAKAEALQEKSAEANKAVIGNAKSLEKDLRSLSTTAQRLSSEINGLTSVLTSQAANATSVKNEERFIYGLGERLGQLRNGIENAALSTCEIYDQVKSTDRISELDKFIGQARSHFADVNSQYGDYQGIASQRRDAKTRVESERQKRGSAESTLTDYEQQITSAQAQLGSAQAQYETIANLTAAVQGYMADIEHITQEAAGLIDTTNLPESSDLSKDDKKTLKQMEKLLGKIKKSQSLVIKSAGSSSSKSELLISSIGSLQNTLSQSRSILDGLRQNFAGVQYQQELDQALGEFQATLDAGDLFVEPIEAAEKNARICMDGIQNQYDAKTTPEARVSQTDCSQWPGTSARWNAAKNSPECACSGSDLWDDKILTCVSEEQFHMSRADCTRFPNSHAQWNAGNHRAECWCVEGYEWNSTTTACRVNAQTQVSQTNCSQYGPAEAYWNSEKEQPWCRCRPGYEWNTNGDLCVQSRSAQVANTNCSNFGPGAEAYWDQARNQPLCRCRVGYQWNANYTFCDQVPAYNPNDFINDMTNIINTIQNGSGTGGGSTTTPPPAPPPTPRDSCETNFTWNGYEMSCLCSGYKYDYSWGKCIRGAATQPVTVPPPPNTNRTTAGSSGGGPVDGCECRDEKGPYESWWGQCGDHAFKDLPDFRDCDGVH